MAASVVKRRYVSAVYEDKYFPEKNVAIPFKWETSPGRPKYDDDDDDYQGKSKDDSNKQGPCVHNMCNESYTYITKDNNQCMQESHIHTSHAHVHAMSIYPLRPPPKVISPASPLRVKDLLLHRRVRDHNLSDAHFDDDDDCPLHAYRHNFSRLSIRFRSLKASTVVPVYKNHCVLKRRSQNGGVDKSQASSLVAHAPVQGRSQSFNHAAMHGAGIAARRAANASDVVRDASIQASERRCNSFNFHPAHHSVIDHDNKVHDDDGDDDDDDDDTSSMAAAAVWAGACILAAAAAHDVVSADHHQHGPCRVAMKLRDLMQQSVNFSELELPMMTKLKKGGGSAINENLTQVALCHGTIAPAAKRKTKSLEEEVVEAFLREGTRKSCTHDDDDDDVEHEPTKEKATHEGEDHPGKLVKRKSFLKVFKNECIACWCPTSTL